LAEVKSFLRVNWSEDDALIAMLITAARRYASDYQRRAYINTVYLQCLDSFPYFTDTMMSQMAYPPSYYSLPKYSTTLWNYSQMIKLFYAPLASAVEIYYVSSATSTLTPLTGTVDVSDTTKDFLCDIQSEPPRIFPNAGQNWPSVLYVPNAVQINYAAGYNDDDAIASAVDTYTGGSPIPSAEDIAAYEATLRQADVPETIKVAIMQLVAHLYENREVATTTKLNTVPFHVQSLLDIERVVDYQPTRG
jgi:hypothetical protein